MTGYIAGMVIKAKPGDKCPCCYKPFSVYRDLGSRKPDEDGFIVCHGCGAIVRYIASTNTVRPMNAEFKEMLRRHKHRDDIRALQEKIVAEMIG